MNWVMLAYQSFLVLVFLGVILYLHHSNKREREALYNRLMARDFTEYATLSREPKQSNRPNNFLLEQMERAMREKYGPDPE